MSSARSAIHLRTGDGPASGAVDVWLEAHAVRTTGFADAYEVCVYVVQHSDQVADLAFVGADGLSAEECSILRYLRETWPSVLIVVYSTTRNAPLCEPEPLRRVCRSQRALQRLLKDPPPQLLAQARTRLTQHDTPEAATNTSAAPSTAQQPRPERAVRPPGERIQDTLNESLRRARLTKEELAALLGEDED